MEDTNLSASNEINKIDEDKSKDHSDKKPVAAKKRVVAVPHYLRLSTGSCHDACKYGKPHVFIEKPWRAVRRTSAPLPKTEKAVEIQIFIDNKLKKSVGVEKLDGPPPTNATVKKGFLSSRKSPNTEKTVESKIFVDNKLKKSVGVDKLDCPPSNKAPATSATVKKSFLSSRKSPLHDSLKLVKQEARPLINSSSKIPKVMKKTVLSPARSSLPEFSKREVASYSIKDLVSNSTPSTPKVRSVSSGTVRPNRPAVRPSLSPDVFKGLRLPGTETKFSDPPRKVFTPATTLSVKRSSKLLMKKPMDLPQATSSLHSSRFTSVKSNNVRNTTNFGQKKDRMLMNKAEVKKPNNEMVKEKTLHMIETQEVSNHFIQSPSPLSPESLNSSTQGNSLSFTSNEVELSTGSTDSDGDDSISNYSRSGNSKAVVQDSTALKLKFRRVKVVELDSGTQGPRKLRFKRGTILGDDQVASSGSRRKTFKKRVVDSDKKEVGIDQEKVALKHQEMVTKKDEQGLLNNVIEETASKLVEKRKSKVKALVGAFETVISLQERKPSTTNKYE